MLDKLQVFRDLDTNIIAAFWYLEGALFRWRETLTKACNLQDKGQLFLNWKMLALDWTQGIFYN